MSRYGVIAGPYFPAFELNTEKEAVRSRVLIVGSNMLPKKKKKKELKTRHVTIRNKRFQSKNVCRGWTGVKAQRINKTISKTFVSNLL